MTGGAISAAAPQPAVNALDSIDLSMRGVERADRSSRAAAVVEPEAPRRRILLQPPAPADPAPAESAPEPAAQPAPEPAPEASPSPTPTATKTPTATSTPTAKAAAPAGSSNAPCADGSAVESGLTKDAIRVHRTVCAMFSGITGYGGLRGSGDFHGTGQALDIMIGSNSALGQQIANFVRANASALGVSQVIWSQHIWTVQRAGDGWRSMPNRGSATANHYDHVHVSVYGSAGTG